MNCKIISFFLLFLSLSTLANANIVVERLQGEVFFNQVPLTLTSVINENGVITTSENSFVKIRNDLWGITSDSWP